MELVLHFEGRPPTHNAKRYSPWYAQAATTRQYREEAGWKATNKPPFSGPVSVTAQPYCRDNRRADAGACFDVVKAVVDGCVDAGVIPDDGPKYVVRYVLEAPLTMGEDRLVVTLSEVT